MKAKLSVLLLILSVLNCCQNRTDSNANSSANVQLDFLQSVQNKSVDDQELIRIVKQVTKYNSVVESDAEILAKIYSLKARNFLDASNNKVISENALFAADVFKFLQLMLQHPKMTESVKETTRKVVSENGEAAGRELLMSYTIARANTSQHSPENSSANGLSGADKLKQMHTKTFVRVFEQTAYGRTQNLIPADPKQMESAKKFLADLKTYDGHLETDGKILDPNGRLKNPFEMTEKQFGNLSNIFREDVDIPGRSGLYGSMNALHQALQSAAERQIQ